MCFAPHVSLSTAVFEFLIAGIVLWRYKNKFARWISIFVAVLGLYQLSEFFMCTVDPYFFAMAGFVIYSFLPALAVHFALMALRFDFPMWVLYLPAVVYSLAAVFTPGFITSAYCSNVFVIAKNMILSNIVSWFLYVSYYSIFILIACAIGFYLARTSKNDAVKRYYYLITLSVLLATIPALVLLVMLPSTSVMFASIYCQFAVIIAIMCLVAARYSERLQN